MSLFRKTELNPEQKKRVPPGQTVTEKWPVLHYGPIPPFNPRTWDFRVFGNVESPFRLTWEEFQQLPKVTDRKSVV